jgi:hypothetical protein
MKIDKKLYCKLETIVESHISRWLKIKLKNNLLEGFDVSFVTNGYDKKFQIHSAIGRSLDSSLGKLYEKLLEAISEHYNDITLTRLKTKKKNGKPYIIDLLFHRNGIANLIEIKLHCELDNKKSLSEKQALDERKEIYIKETKLSNKKVNIFMGVVGNKDGDKPTDFKMGRLSEHFDRSEVLVEKELFNFVSGRNGFFEEFSKFNSKFIIPKVNQSIELIEKNYE